jgi:DNA polymerase III alpha subunit
VFTCALLNSQPMGFYAPAQLVRDAREHGVEVRGADINASGYDNLLERRGDGSLAIRLGFRQIGQRPRYYEHPEEDALIFAADVRNLGQDPAA